MANHIESWLSPSKRYKVALFLWALPTVLGMVIGTFIAPGIGTLLACAIGASIGLFFSSIYLCCFGCNYQTPDELEDIENVWNSSALRASTKPSELNCMVFHKPDFDSTEALFVSVDELATATPESDYPIIGTLGAGQCLILGVYDSNLKKALIANIAGIDKHSFKQINTLVSQLNGFTQDKEAYILGGLNNSASQKTHQVLIQLLQMMQFNIIDKAFEVCPQGAASLAIDSRDGRCYLGIESTHFQNFINRATAFVPLGEIAVVENSKEKWAKTIDATEQDDSDLESQIRLTA